MTETAVHTLPRVLFVCTHNSARSQMAEALLRDRASDRFDVHSAGFKPRTVHPLAIQAMDEVGIDLRNQQATALREYLGRIAVVHGIVVCEPHEVLCPSVYPFAHCMHYWPFTDPGDFGGPAEGRIQRFREVRDAIAARIDRWLAEGAPGRDKS